MTRKSLPWWTGLVLLALFAPLALVHEQVFGGSVGLIAAAAGVLIGTLVALVSSRLRWDFLATAVTLVAAYFVFGGAAALAETTLWGLVPTARTIQLLALQPVTVWKDLLTLNPPAASYVGPAVLPWMTGLVCSFAATLITVRWGRYALGTLPILSFGVIGVAWGPAGTAPTAWPIAAWIAGVLAWWAWANQLRRIDGGEEVLIGRRGVSDQDSLSDSLTATGGGRVSVVYGWRRLAAVLGTLLLAVAVALPLTGVLEALDSRIVLRDLIEPPLDVRDYPSPLSSFRHYTTDLEKSRLVTASSLPGRARIRLGVMDTYNGIAFGMSDPQLTKEGRYVRVGSDVRSQPEPGAGETATITLTTDQLSGHWLPSVGAAETWDFSGGDAAALGDGLYYNYWADAALSTAFVDGKASYTIATRIAPVLSDGQLNGVSTPQITGTPDSNVPEAVSELATTVVAAAESPLDRARAIERYLTKNGRFSNSRSANSRPGHRADRIARMLALDQLIGDDEQYSVLMALMLHSQGIPARVVMGLYPRKPTDGEVVLTGNDVHAWVEVPFTDVGWATFDPTPPKTQIPQTEVQKPRSVPKPQVLPPPDPPEPPVELPPAVSDRQGDDRVDDGPQIPWLILGSSVGGLILLLGPFLLILGLKQRRRRIRRSSGPQLSVPGAWNEAVDQAVDAGAAVPHDLTRQETAGLLATSLLADSTGPKVDWWDHGATVPTVVSLARQADAATFAPVPPTDQDAAKAWDDLAQVSADLNRDANWWTRLRRRTSLRSLRRNRRRRRTRARRRSRK